jgi:CheY-like chemotaxis protein
MDQNHVYLVAEDDANTRILLKRAFLKAGFNFPLLFTKDGVETMAYLKGEGRFANRDEYPYPAILLLDLNMPKMNGHEVLKAMRGAEPPLRRLTVIMFSSSVEEKDVERSYEFGANSYVEKPTEFVELVQTVTCINQYWFGCNFFPHPMKGIVRPRKKHR